MIILIIVITATATYAPTLVHPRMRSQFRHGSELRHVSQLGHLHIPGEGVTQPAPHGVRGARLAVGHEDSARGQAALFEPVNHLRVIGVRRESFHVRESGRAP